MNVRGFKKFWVFSVGFHHLRLFEIIFRRYFSLLYHVSVVWKYFFAMREESGMGFFRRFGVARKMIYNERNETGVSLDDMMGIGFCPVSGFPS